MPGLTERILFYPVAVITTLAALMGWSYQPVWFAILLSILAIGLWVLPLLGQRFIRLREIVFWLTTTLLLVWPTLVVLWGLG